jgi:hypothetical protein
MTKLEPKEFAIAEQQYDVKRRNNKVRKVE